MDTTKLATYSESYLQELRAAAVKRADDARFLIARGAIGKTRLLAKKEVVAGRAERDAIDVELKKRQPQGEVATVVEVAPTEVARMFEPVEPADVAAAALEPDLDLLLDDPPAVPKRSSSRHERGSKKG